MIWKDTSLHYFCSLKLPGSSPQKPSHPYICKMANSSLLHLSNFFSSKLATALVWWRTSASYTEGKCFRQTARKRNATTKFMDGFKNFLLYLDKHWGLVFYAFNKIITLWFSSILWWLWCYQAKESCKFTVPIPNFRCNWWTLVFHSAL